MPLNITPCETLVAFLIGSLLFTGVVVIACLGGGWNGTYASSQGYTSQTLPTVTRSYVRHEALPQTWGVNSQQEKIVGDYESNLALSTLYMY